MGMASSTPTTRDPWAWGSWACGSAQVCWAGRSPFAAVLWAAPPSPPTFRRRLCIGHRSAPCPGSDRRRPDTVSIWSGAPPRGGSATYPGRPGGRRRGCSQESSRPEAGHRANGLEGVEATAQIVASQPDVKVLVLTTFDADRYVLQALRAGATGYVLKDSEPAAISSSIMAVLSGERVMAGAVANRVLDMLTGASTPKAFYDGLTAREVEILKLMATGKPNKQIAFSLKISEKTVRNHISHIYEKLQIYDRAQAVLYAVRKNLVEL